MVKRSVSLCYYPTLVVMVDDDVCFLKKISKELYSNKILVKCFTDPHQAVQFLQNSYKKLSSGQDPLSAPEKRCLQPLMFNFDLRLIKERLYYSERFTEVLLLTTEYSLSEMEGLSINQYVDKENTQVMLLSGRMGPSFAIEAFNAGLIKQFLMKTTPNLIDVLIQAILTQQYFYFQRHTSALFFRYPQLKNLESTLSDPIIIDFFEKVCAKNEIVEYYLLDKEGSFLLVDGKANLKILILKDEGTIRNYYQEAQNASGTPAFIMEALNNRSHIPFFYLTAEAETLPSQWDKFLYPAKLIKGERSNYYYALISNVKHPEIQTENVVAYYRYLEQQK